MGPRHHSILWWQVADGGDGIKVWRVNINIEQAVAGSQQGLVLELGGWARC